MEITYKGCKYTYNYYFDYSGKIDKSAIVLTKIKPIDDSNNIVFIPNYLDGKKIQKYEYGLLPNNKEYEIVLEEGIDCFDIDSLRCEIIGLTLPKSLTTIYFGHSKIRNHIKKIVVHKDNPCFDSRNNSNCLIESKTNKLILIGVDSGIPNSVNEIGEDVFCSRQDFELDYLTIPSSITIIGESAFSMCWLPFDFNLPSTIKVIGARAFLGAKRLLKLDLPNVEIIKDSAFCSTELSTINFGNSLKVIGNKVFSGCNQLKELTLPDSLIEISPDAFCSCNIKTIYCSKRVADLIIKTKASTKIKLVIDGKEPIAIGDLLNKPEDVFDLESCLKTRQNYFARNINIDLIVEYQMSFDNDLPQSDYYNYADYKYMVMGSLDAFPVANASNFNYLTNPVDGRILIESYEIEDTDFITLASTNVLQYLKYDYDSNNDVYHIKGVKDVRSIGFLSLGFGKEKMVIETNAFVNRKIVNLYLGPNVVAVMENAFPSLTTCTISIAEGVNYIGPNAFTRGNKNIPIRYGGQSIPNSWSKKWNQHGRIYYEVNCNFEPLKLSEEDVVDKINNYDKYADLTYK